MAGSAIGCRSPAFFMDVDGSGGWLVVVFLPPCWLTRGMFSSPCDSNWLNSMRIASDASHPLSTGVVLSSSCFP